VTRNSRRGLLGCAALLAGASLSAVASPAAEQPQRPWTQADFGGVLSVGLEGHRDYAAGLRHYRARCSGCHTLGRHGDGPAPDLTRRALTYSPEELLGHLLSTSKHLPTAGKAAGLLDTLPQAGVLDLLAFVLSGADPQSPFFLHP
jgi:mono/diheme cytochrome c family protein